MKLKKPKFWDYKKPNIISYLLLPISLLLAILKVVIDALIKKKKYLSIKTICVGNIYLGGTGKTSLSLKINEILGSKVKSCFIKKYYSNQIDEQKILANYLNQKEDLPQLNKQFMKVLKLRFLMMVYRILL